MTGNHATRALIVATLGLVLGAHAYLLPHQNVNWDEFWFLSFVHDHARGTLSATRQSFHVHLFGWLTGIAAHEVDQVVAARAAYLILLVGTCTCVYTLGRRVASVNGALFAVLCYAGYSNVLAHGTSFRTDGLSVFLLMTALVLVQSEARRMMAAGAAAVLVGVALLVTIKSALFLPVFALVLLTHHSRDWRGADARREAALFVGATVATAVGLYLWHQSGVVNASVSAAVTSLQSTAGRAIRPDVLFPRYWEFRETVIANLVQWTALTSAVVLLAVRILTRRQVPESMALLVLVVPLLSVVVYRNAFPYFYVVVMAPALVLCAWTFDQLARSRWMSGYRSVAVTIAATLALAVSVRSFVATAPRDDTAAQRAVVGAVHEIFPEPVPYIDRNGMIASFPRVGFFMSSWGIERYREEGRPVFASLLRARGPKFLLVNVPALSAALADPSLVGRGRTDVLLGEDAAVLRAHFVPYWGPIHVAGTAMHLQPGSEVTWEVLIAGLYQLHSRAPVAVGNALHQPGATVELGAGVVSFRSEVAQDVMLRTSSARGVPPYPPPTGRLYRGF
ncbi:MAG: glycosyltransferase family 39 protein [Acidobacteriota bacterium]|nr:glycosyltransferase family 39 protein [Acidobacteriota bacterium]